ncbi:MAG: S9 family peptidase [Acidobacteria bacterium]|nr:S9 family peptidase [Acidobacteriota bacterium]
MFAYFFLSFLVVSGAAVWAEPPVAKRVDHREERHGATVIDPYFWLREKSNPEVVRYLEEENAYTAEKTAHLKTFEEKIYKEIVGRMKQTDLSVPYRRGPYYYYSRTEEGKQYPIHCRRKGNMEGPEEILLDGNQLAKGLKFFSVGAMSLSEDHQMLAFTTDTTGFRQYKLQVKNLATGEMQPDIAERVTSVQWASDNRTLLFTTEEKVTKRSDTLWRLTLGKPVEGPLYQEKDELFRVHLSKTRDQKYLVLQIGSTDTTEVRYTPADQPHQALRVVLPREKKHRYDIDHRNGVFYIRTNKGAKNFRMVTAPAADPSPANWKEFLPHQSNVLLQGIDLFKDFGVVVEKSEAVNRLRFIDFQTGKWKALTFPEPVYAASPSANPEYDTNTFRYLYQSMVTPASVFDYDVATGASKLLKQEEVLGGYDPKQYVTERVWAKARDGVRVPMSVVYKRGVKRDGKAPLFLYGYGSYGIGMSATFSNARLSLLDRGMIYVVAHIRGGNEMGELWHEDGMLMKKKNTFQDFIDCAEFLIKEKWTSRERLVMEGGSAGGLLIGAVINMRPDLFRAAHMAVPFVDVMNTMMDASLPLTVGEYLEWGNPNEKQAYDYMKTYSPYDNLEKRAYPAILVTTSLNDSQVMYWEPAKYVARLRTLKTDENPLLLKTNMGAGHGGASGRYDRLREVAFQYAWLMQQAGITE